MKKLLTLALVTLMTMSATAQNNFQGRMERQSRADRTEAINKQATSMAKDLKLKKENKDMFIALFLEWQGARFNAINPEGGDQEAEEATATVDYKEMTDDQAKELVAKNFERQEKQMAVDKEFYNKFMDILTPVQAAQVMLETRGVEVPSSAMGAGMMRRMAGAMGGGMPMGGMPMGGMPMGGGMPMMGGF